MHKLSKYFFINENKSLFYCLILAFLIRLIFFYIYPDQKFPDSISYEILGIKFLENFIYESDVHMPLYSILSLLIGGRVNLIIFDIMISSLTSLYIYKLSKLIFTKEISFIALIIYILYPYSIFYSVSGLTETIYVFLIIFSFYKLYNKKYLTAIFVLILSIYLRPTLEIFYPIILLIFLYVNKQLNINKIFYIMFSYLLMYVILLSPWWYHNHIKYNQFVRLNFASGFVLYSGNNPLNESGGGVAYGSTSDDLDISSFQSIKDPGERYNAMKEEAIKFIINNPKRTINLYFKKFQRFWMLYPYTNFYNAIEYKIISILSYGVILLFSILTILNLNLKKIKMLLPIFSFAIFLNFVHIITISSIRYRYPIEPFLIILSSNYIFYIYTKFNGYFNSR
tara:strand:+ start:296 stop:1483 length:1188 start_codon:yes stop_codon:yes gene_type:complete